MTTTATIPISVTPEAAARVAELGMQRELQQMLEHTLQTVPGLRSIEVQLALPYDTGGDSRITLEATMDDPHDLNNPTEQQWRDWKIRNYPPEVWSNFVMLTVYGTSP